MTNLLQETLKILTENGKTPKDIRWAGYERSYATPAQIGSFDDFMKLADIEYDNGYGSNEIEANLKIVGDDWWLERGEYDGSEWWEFKTLPAKPEAPEKLDTLFER